ncbi:MAG: hypothetical protein ACI92E_000373 [Oceanicoccus sp.]|jgi:hypothetical protein
MHAEAINEAVKNYREDFQQRRKSAAKKIVTNCMQIGMLMNLKQE